MYVHAEKNVICYDHARSDLHEREYIQNSQIYEMQKLRKKICAKKVISRDNIYMVLQFTYIHRVTRISLFTRKKYKIRQYIFLSQNNIKTLIPMD